MNKFLPFLIIAASLLRAQDFSEFRARYDQYEENDVRALPLIQEYIAHAKMAGNNRELFQAYKDAVHFVPNHKLAYADSSIWAAAKTQDRALIATAYLTKGTVYYFNYRKFQPALDEYLIAWKYTKDSPDPYLHYKNLYHIGVVKSYLGYYAEALEVFGQCRQYFEKPQILPEPPNVKFNRKKGYLNALYQSANCLIKRSEFNEAQKLIDEGLNESGAQADFYLERSFFYQLKGIIALHRGHQDVAVSALKTALLGFEKKNDFTNASLSYFYMGKGDLLAHRKEAAVKNFAKVDSVFTKYNFLLPEARESYEFLIGYYHQQKNKDREHYYTLQLLKADQVLSSDFKYLSGKIYKSYDTEELLASKERLEHSVSSLYTVIWSVTVVLVSLVFLLFYFKESRIWVHQIFTGEKGVSQDQAASDPVSIKKSAPSTQKVPDEITEAVLKKLAVLEEKHFFLEKGMTLTRLAPMLHTNSSYLSKIIKEYRGSPYNMYIKQLRIGYASKMLCESKQWRSFTLEHLAHACGFADRTNFSEAFFEYHQVKPLEFIQRIREGQTPG